MNKSISNKIKYLYFFLTLGMVMYHAKWLNIDSIKYINNLDYKALNFYSKFADHIGTVCMSFFFFMSAFWFYQNINNKKDLINKWKKRVKTLIIPFFLWTIILLSYKIVFLGLEFKFEDFFYHLFEHPAAGPLWYLLALLLLQLISPVLLCIKKHKKTTTFFLLGLSIYLVLRRYNYVPTLFVFKNWWWYENMLTYTPLYLLGVYLGMYHSNLIVEKEYLKINYTIVGFILLIISFILWHFFPKVSSMILSFYSLIELTGIWFILKPRFCTNDIPKILNCNFYVYALHNPILVPLTQKVINLFLRNNYICGIVMIIIKIIQIVAVLMISVFVKMMVIKFLPKKADSYLTGDR